MKFTRQPNKNLTQILLILLILLMVVSLQSIACSKTISICSQDCEFTSITKAIDSADPGDIIEVQSGTYFENVNISKQITLLGKDTGLGKPVIDAGENGSAITISADGANVEGFNLTNSLGSWLELWAGIEVNSNHNTIINNLAFNNENGILIAGSNNTIQGNDALNNIYGIKIKGSANNSILGNDLKNNNYGLFILDSKNNTIQRNQAINNEFGISLNDSVGNNLSQNQMNGNRYNFGCHGNNYVDTDNIADGKSIYYLVRLANQEINSSSNAATVCCIDCYNMTVTGLDLENSLYGIYLDNTSYSLIEGNNLSNNSNAIALVNSYHNSIKNNRANSNIEGIVLTNSRYNTLNGNKALKSQAGLHLAYSDYNQILDNQASDSEKGFWLFRSGLNVISENHLTSNSIGGFLSFSWLNKILNNSVTDNIQGILLDSSANNNLSGNKVFNNSRGLLFDPLDNNTLNTDNEIQGNGVDFERITSRTTAAGGIPPSIAINIDSSPKDAAILKGEEFQGLTRGAVYFTEPGEYTLKIKKDGYKDGYLTIEIPEKFTPEATRELMSDRSIKLIPEEDSEGEGTNGK